MKAQTQSLNRRKFKSRGEQAGYTIVQMVITVALIGVVTSFAFISISRARARMALQNSVRLLASNIEKTRIDAVRRHSDPISSPTTASKVWFTSPNTYTVQMDFAGTGTPTTRTFTLEQDLGLDPSSPLPTINFNWRGRTAACTQTFGIFSPNEGQSTVDISDAGEVTIDTDVDVLPSVTYATTNQTTDVSSSAVVTGSGSHNNSVDCTLVDSGGTPGPPASGGGSGGCPGWTVNPSSLSIKKQGGSSGTISFGVTSGGSAVVSVVAPVNLQVTPAAASLSSGGTATFTVTSLNKTRGTYAVTFNLPCSSPQVMVKVTN